MTILDDINETFGTYDLYRVLDVSTTASEEEIRKAYHLLSLKNHPDRIGGDDLEKDLFKARFQLLTQVYSILGDANRRRIYDEQNQLLYEEKESEHVIYDEISLSDCDYDHTDKLYTYSCRCSENFILKDKDLGGNMALILHVVNIDQFQYSHPPLAYDNNVVISDSPQRLMWFLQITDLHLSCIGHEDRKKDLRKFATDYISIIKPSVVLATGDLTDGRKPGTIFNTGPQLEEWKAYSDIIKETEALNRTVWLDVRGNHDNFNVYRPKDPSSLYRQYSIRGKENARNYKYKLEKNGYNYTFIGVDGVQTPGLKIPFNFIGIVDQTDLDQLKSFVDESTRSESTIWFGHYPTSSIASPGIGLRSLINGPYLCGHYHTLANFVKKMHATQQPGFAEIELGDWKYNRRLRLAAVDHQLFSFVDLNFNQWPIALVTNPKQPEFAMPKYEPIERILTSTHIRVIAFSDAEIKTVRVKIDNAEWMDMQHKEGPLYVKGWRPHEYNKGLHVAKILVIDSKNRQRTFEQDFSMDGSKAEHSLGARILIRLYFKSYIMSMFYFLITTAALPLLVLRIVRYRYKDLRMKNIYSDTLLYKVYLTANIDRLFYPLFIIPLWMAMGPMFIGRFVDEAIGVCFVWGIWIDGSFIHTGITFTVGSISMVIHMTISTILCSKVNQYHRLFASVDHMRVNLVDLKFIIYLILTALQVLISTIFYSAYGALAFFTSFPFFWCPLIYIYCWYQIVNLQQNDFEFKRFTQNQQQS